MKIMAHVVSLASVCVLLSDCALKPKTLQERIMAGEDLTEGEYAQRAAEREAEASKLKQEQKARMDFFADAKKILESKRASLLLRTSP
jgi:hypothetical protein